ncbi:MAG: HTTM domain-containing protein [Planctomycetaceae bacterium]
MSGNLKRTSVFQQLHEFFYAEQSPYGLALVRMLLPAVALIPMFRRFPRVRELFSSDGAPQQLAELFGHGAALPELPPALASGLYGLMLFALVSAIFGFRTRIALLTGTPLYIYFNLLDAVGTMTKYTVIASHVLLILSISPCGAVWSVDALLKRWREGRAAAIPPTFPVWPARLIQMLFAFVYFGAAITKVQTTAFFSGEQMRYWMFSDWNYPNPLGELVAMSPAILLASGYLTVVWEVSFPFLAWRPIGRFYALGFGVVFHLLTIFLLGLYIFPFICIPCYLVFLMEADIVSVRNVLRRIRFPSGWIAVPRVCLARLIAARPASVPLPLLWAGCAMLATVMGAEADYRFDVYGTRAAGKPLPLKPLDPVVARTMINSQRPLREKDKFFSFNIGTRMMAGQLANVGDTFRIGDTIIAQCNLNTPHEDLWVECVVEDEQRRVVDVAGQFVTRDLLFSNFPWKTCDRFVPGRYFFVLKSSGQEIARRAFTLTGDACPVPSGGAGILTN